MTGKRSYISGEVFTGLRTNARMTFASICAIAICLVLVGLIAILGDIFFRAVDQQAASAEYFVYIEENATDAERMALQENIQLTPNVKEVEFISKETAKKDFAAFLETDALDGLPADIFRDRFVITMSDGSKAKETISIIEGYESVGNTSESVNVSAGFERIREGAKIIFAFVAVTMAALSFVIVSNTLSCSAMQREKESSILRLCGVSEFHIRLPLVLEGTVMGALAAILAIALEFVIYAMFCSLLRKNGIDAVLPLSSFSHYWLLLPAFFAAATGTGCLAGLGQGRDKER